MDWNIKNLGFTMIGTTEMLLQRKTEFIFILAMARSGSSLLTHILTSNPDIDGIGETKIKPASFAGLRRILGKTRYLQWRYKMPKGDNARYILDKLVHDELLQTQDIAILNDDRFKVIFLIREPQATIQSHVNAMSLSRPSTAIKTYVRRARTLRLYMEQLAPLKPCMALTYNQLINCTTEVFSLLEAYLELSEPLSEKYETTQATGKFALGDNSANIQSGHIVRRNKRKKERPPIPPEKLTAARQEYEACKQVINQYCYALNPLDG